MAQRVEATFTVQGWTEHPFHEIEGGPRLTRASVAKRFEGAVEGDGVLEYLMIHHSDGSASFTGLERVVGRVGDRSGSFVLQHTGTYEGGTATASWFVVPGSGTGDLTGMRGEGGFSAPHAERYVMTLDYRFD